MIISQARSTNPISSFFLVTFFWCLNLCLVVWEVSIGFSIWDNFPFLVVVLSQSSILGTALIINFTLQKNKFVGVGDALGGIIFLIFTLGLNDLHTYYKELISLFIIAFTNLRLIGIHNAVKDYLREFEVGILFGLVVLISPSFFMLSLMLLIGITLVVSFTWRDFIVLILGFLLVFVMKFVSLFLMDSLVLQSFFPFNFSYPRFDAQFNLIQILITLISLFEFVVLVRLFSVIEKRSIKERVYYWLWIWTAVFLFLSLLFFQQTFNKFVLILILGLPCSVFSIEYFSKKGKSKGKWKEELILYCVILSVLGLRVL